MKIVFYFSHPSQYLFLRETVRRIEKKDDKEVYILIKTKDVLEDLIKSDKLEYENILPEERGKSKLAIALSLFNRIFIMFTFVRRLNPDLLVGTDASLALISFIFRKKCITTIEDDYEIVKTLARITYPFTSTILCPIVCNVGNWESKKIGYNGFMKLGYLHPNVFTPDSSIILKYSFPKNYAIIRLARLTAHHDFGIKGIDYELLDKIIRILETNGLRVYISSEAEIEKKYNKFLLNIQPSDIHHVLFYSKLFISDSQSMSVEASMLGVPSLRYSSFAGKISVLEELETMYKLTFGIPVGNEEMLVARLSDLLSREDLSESFQIRRMVMLNDKIDVTKFMTWFIGEYPKSKVLMDKDNEFQNKFR